VRSNILLGRCPVHRWPLQTCQALSRSHMWNTCLSAATQDPQNFRQELRAQRGIFPQRLGYPRNPGCLLLPRASPPPEIDLERHTHTRLLKLGVDHAYPAALDLRLALLPQESARITTRSSRRSTAGPPSRSALMGRKLRDRRSWRSRRCCTLTRPGPFSRIYVHTFLSICLIAILRTIMEAIGDEFIKPKEFSRDAGRFSTCPA